MAPKICIVTGASRGIGRGIALSLCEQGHTVYITGRTLSSTDRRDGVKGQQFGSLAETAEAAQARGGRCVAVAVDHNDDTAVAELFARVDAEQGRLDLLVNNCFAAAVDGMQHGMMATGKGFWEKPLELWEANMNVGFRSHYVASVFASKRMVKAKSGLIVNISSPGGLKWLNDVLYGVAKAGLDRLTRDMAHEFKILKTGVVAVGLWPGMVGTELVKDMKHFPEDQLESVEYTGRVVAALLANGGEMNLLGRYSGKTLCVGELAVEYGVTDVDGKQPCYPDLAAEMDLLIGGNRGLVYKRKKLPQAKL